MYRTHKVGTDISTCVIEQIRILCNLTVPSVSLSITAAKSRYLLALYKRNFHSVSFCTHPIMVLETMRAVALLNIRRGLCDCKHLVCSAERQSLITWGHKACPKSPACCGVAKGIYIFHVPLKSKSQRCWFNCWIASWSWHGGGYPTLHLCGGLNPGIIKDWLSFCAQLRADAHHAGSAVSNNGYGSPGYVMLWVCSHNIRSNYVIVSKLNAVAQFPTIT